MVELKIYSEPYKGEQSWICRICRNIRETHLIKPKCLTENCEGDMTNISATEGTWDFMGKSVFLTYTKVEKRLAPAKLVDIIQGNLRPKGNRTKDYAIEKWIATKEQHRDGSYHAHAYIELDTQLRTQNKRLFDIQYNKRKTHPNWQKVSGNKHRLFAYVKKDGEYANGIGWQSNFETRPQELQLALEVRTPQEFYEKMSYLATGSNRWRAAEKVMIERFKKEEYERELKLEFDQDLERQNNDLRARHRAWEVTFAAIQRRKRQALEKRKGGFKT